MKRIMCWKKTTVVMLILFTSMILMSGFASKATAVDTPTTIEVTAAESAGTMGGAAVFAGLTSGHIALGAYFLAAGAAWAAYAASSSTTGHH